MHRSGTAVAATPNLPFISVVMPVRNEAGFISQSIGAVLAQDYPPDRIEIVVADGMSTDATRDLVTSIQMLNPNVRLLDNLGQIAPTGLNAAIAQSSGEIVVRVDGHCEIADDYIRRCVAHLLNDGVDGVGGALETVGKTPTARAIAAAMSSPFGVGNSAFRTVVNRTMMTDTVAFPAYTRAVIERAGQYDEELIRNQDDEYNYRLRKMGAKILLASDVRSRYYSRSSLPYLFRQYFQYGYWKVRVLQKHPLQMQPRHFVPSLFVATLLVTLLASPFFVTGRAVFCLVAISYLVATLAASVITARNSSWWMLPLFPATFASLHLAYGSGFLVGLLKFWNRWGDRGAR